MVLLILDNNEYAAEVEKTYSVQRVENPAQYIPVMDLIPKFLIVKKTKNGVNARTKPAILPTTKSELIRSRTTLTVEALHRDIANPNRIWVRTKSGLYILYDPAYCELKWR
jgi:ribosomal protein S24E